MSELYNLYNFVAFDNDFDTDDRAWVPEVWAAETLAILEENMVIGRLVHTDFSNEIKEYGDVVNTRRPGTFSANRKGTNDDITVQDATAEKVAVVLNQNVETSFLIRDTQQSLSFKDLVETYLQPAALSLAQHIDKILLGQVYQYLDNCVGDIDQMNATASDAHNAKSLILDLRNAQNKKNVPLTGRNLIWTPDSETNAIKLDLFISAEKVGDEGTALREASLGRKLGYDNYMCQNTPSVSDTIAASAVNADDIAAVSEGATVVVSDDGSAYTVGEYIYFVDPDGSKQDRMPYRVIAIDTNDLTLNRALRVALSANSDSYQVPMGAVALTEHTAAGGPTAYPAGYDKTIYVDGTGVPQVGQLVSFNNGATVLDAEYCIIKVTEVVADTRWAITLDRPLEAALADGYTVGYGPGGDYNFAFTRNALALVNRPLGMPKSTESKVGVASYNGLSMRVEISRDPYKKGDLVTLDLLCGVKVLDEDQGAVLIG